MAEVIPILTGLAGTVQFLTTFAKLVQDWREVPERLFEIEDNLHVQRRVFNGWRKRYCIHDGRSISCFYALFGKEGFEDIRKSLGMIKMVSERIQKHVDSMVGGAMVGFAYSRGHYRERHDEEIIKEYLRRISKTAGWGRKSIYTLLKKADELDKQVELLEKWIKRLQFKADSYLEEEHPEVFRTVKRLPGRRIKFQLEADVDSIIYQLDSIHSACKDAKRLQIASQHQRNIHIGLFVPQIHSQDFLLLISVGDHAREVLAHPVRFRAINDPLRVQSNLESAARSLERWGNATGYLQPSPSSASGFQLTFPRSRILASLRYEAPLCTLIRNNQSSFQRPAFYPQDQYALATGIVTGSVRLLGNGWLQFLDSCNLRSRRDGPDRWATMLSAVPGNPHTTRILDQCYSVGHPHGRDLFKHIQIFRLGLVLTEIALQSPIDYIDFHRATEMVGIHIGALSDDGDDVNANDIAAEVEHRTNLLFGNMVYFCLSVLQNKSLMRDENIEIAFYKSVLHDADELAAAFSGAKRRRNVGPALIDEGPGN